MKNTIGIIGNGSFGSFLVRKLTKRFKVLVHDPFDMPEKTYDASLEEISRCAFIILAIPIDAYRKVLPQLKPLITKDTTIVDISSVKTEPVQLLDELLPGQKRVVTHPLFGPQSAEKSYWGHVVIMCPSVSDPNSYAKIKDFVISEGLAVVEKTPEEHDKEMAYAQGLTFFLARALLKTGVHDVSLHTPSFKKLLDLAELESHHSEELFKTIQQGNPYVSEIRKTFLKEAQDLDKSL